MSTENTEFRYENGAVMTVRRRGDRQEYMVRLAAGPECLAVILPAAEARKLGELLNTKEAKDRQEEKPQMDTDGYGFEEKESSPQKTQRARRGRRAQRGTEKRIITTKDTKKHEEEEPRRKREYRRTRAIAPAGVVEAVLAAAGREYGVNREALVVNEPRINRALSECRGICYQILRARGCTYTQIAKIFNRSNPAVYVCLCAHRNARTTNPQIGERKRRIEFALI